MVVIMASSFYRAGATRTAVSAHEQHLVLLAEVSAPGCSPGAIGTGPNDH
jgi:hypothetical protein